MKKILLLLGCLTLGLSPGWAQQNVTGTITDAQDGGALPGVNVVVAGTTQGTITDIDGNYSISTPGDGTLVFSSIGYAEQRVEVNGRSTIDVTMSEDVQELQEVVVTALGVERSTKALQYSISQVDGENLTQAREINVANSLAGRVAGVNVSNIASGPAGSSRVIIRGNKSLQGNNQPLYVVDGIPMDNSSNNGDLGLGQAGVWGGSDQGDGMSSINPDDIASITVLKGANAAALYGSRAANGVINIVTKKGTARKGIGVQFNSNYVFEQVNNLTDLQKEYGTGSFQDDLAAKPVNQAQAYDWGDDSWGPRFDGSQVIQFDGVDRPYAYAGDNWSRYYQTGNSWTNTLSLTGGGENQTFRFSVSDLRSEAIIPNSGFDRLNVSLATDGKFGEKLSFNAKVLYSHEEAKNRPRLSDSPGNGVQAVYRIPPNVNVNDYRGDPNKLGAIPEGTDEASLSLWGKSAGEEFQQASNNWGQNPWWTAYQFINSDTRDRIIPSGQLRYDITDFLYIQGRAGMDWYTRRNTGLTPQGTGYQRGGSLSEGELRVREINLEGMLGFDQAFGKLNVNAFIGANRMRRNSERISADGNGFNIPFFPAITNAATRNFGYYFEESGINSVFGSAEVSYNGFIFLTATARNDWFSVLNPELNSLLYPSIGTSFVFSDALSTLPNWLSFGKIRASWAQVGNVSIGPYNTNLTYSLNSNPHRGITLASFSSAMGNNGSIPNAALIPLTSTELEFGMDVRFLENRLGLDVTYYRQKTTDDILDATISRASGFGSTKVNVGELQNRGLEVLLTATPVQGPFIWDFSFNFAKNENKVVKLIDGNEELIVEEPRTRTVFVKQIEGQPFGMLTGYVQERSPDGQLVFDRENGAPIRSEEFEIIGNGVADWTGGFNNTFSYKGFNLGFLIDFKVGGDLYSGTNVRLTQWGLHKQTLEGREGGFTVSGVAQSMDAEGAGVTDANGDPVYEPFSKTLTPAEAQNYWIQVGDRTQDRFIYDASFAKLRQLTFGYDFSSQVLENTPFQSLSLSFVARNLALLYSNVDNIDPESTYSSSNAQGLDYFGMPAVRSYGFNLRVGF